MTCVYRVGYGINTYTYDSDANGQNISGEISPELLGSDVVVIKPPDVRPSQIPGTRA